MARTVQASAPQRATAFPRAWTFLGVFDLEPMHRVQMIKHGLPASVPGDVAQRMGISKERLLATLGLPRATVERKLRQQQVLSPDESARVLGMARLGVGQVQRMEQESGQPEGFDAAAWVARWIDRPVPALGGLKPAELLDTAEGQAIVANVLSRAQTGAYS